MDVSKREKNFMKNKGKLVFQLSFVIFFGFVILAMRIANAQITPTPAAPSEIANTNTPIVTKVEGTCALFNTITITVKNLSELLEKQTKNDLSKIILYLDGYPVKGISSRLVGGNSEQIKFDLQRTSDSEKSWDSLLGRPEGFTKPISITVGLENKPIDTECRDYPLTVVNSSWFCVYICILGITVGLFIMLAIYSNILRDPGLEPPGNNKKGRRNRKPFSLARTQMAFWFLLVVASYSFIWMITSAYSTLTSSVLALIGISASTMLGATIIDYSKRNDADSQLKTRQLEKARLETERDNLNAIINTNPPPANLENPKKELAEKRVRLDQVDKEILDLTSAVNYSPSEGFFKDILSDANGISFCRFQIAAWTAVLGIIFISSVLNVLTMPDFPKELLALMGISSGTYIGFKFPEKQS